MANITEPWSFLVEYPSLQDIMKTDSSISTAE